ncbi:hypothetical protein [Cellulomonas cellasea]|uniref:Lipoprotein n=1 Tax=Cellulomonas cellasea TaxID=43670 RepID=A0A7W4YC78_9CELL|nr:hypothetical protein [Cellulomonas cellasea]MBB2923261.1 hypothetical protein [Cellulomonas cellasea]
MLLAATVLALVGVGGPPATAAPPEGVLCSSLPRQGEAVHDLRIRGDLIADSANGTGCFLERVVVDGDVHAASYLGLTGSTVHGDVTVTADGHVAVVDGAAVLGDVVLDTGAYSWRGLGMRDATIYGSVRGTAGTVQLYGLSGRSVVHGDYDVTTTSRLQMVRSTVWGHVGTRDGRLLLHDSALRDGLTSTGQGVLVCRSSVDGDLTVTHAHAYGRLGLEGTEPCGTSVTGSVHLVDNPHSIDLGALTVAGDLVCTGNTGPRVVTWTAATAVTGTRTGQCA